MNENEFGFGLIVKRSRTEQNFTLSELSEKTNGVITASYINRLENGQKTKPSFDVVAELCKVLNLDIREVISSLGYGSIIKDHEQDDVYSIEDIFRINNVKLPNVIGERLINREEQEVLIRITKAIFEYSFAEEATAIDKLTSIIKQIHSLRELEQSQLIQTESFEIQSMDITYTVEFDRNMKQDISDPLEWEEVVKTAVTKYENFIRDYPNGFLTMHIGNQEWIVEKVGSTLKLLFKKADIVSL
jgi:transcriptional regulator with XRE-family HTH domain